MRFRLPILATAFLIASGSTEAATPGHLTAAPALARAYHYILNAQFEQADEELKAACQSAPQPACDVLAATRTWWSIQIDPASRVLDPLFTERVERAIRETEAWAAREPGRAEAWFYVGAAYGLRVQWHVLRDEKLAAARDGKRIRDTLEEAIKLDSALDDAYFGLGLYQYYADIAPTAAKLLRWLLFLPGGDRVAGLAQMVRARSGGELISYEADYQLYLIYLWYERQPKRALEFLEGLRNRFPMNPMFLEEIGRIQHVYFHDDIASLVSYRRLLSLAQQNRVGARPVAEIRARLGIADRLDAIAETDRAIEQLQVVIAAAPAVPYSSLAEAQLRLGRAFDRIGDRQRAIDAYKAAIASAPEDDPFKTRPQARRALQHAPPPGTAQAYRLSIEAWRLFERRAYVEAEEAIDRSVAMNPTDAVIRYREGRILEARGQIGPALKSYELSIGATPALPSSLLAVACLRGGLLTEQSGDVARAIELLERAATLQGSDTDTRAAANQALTRLRRSADF